MLILSAAVSNYLSLLIISGLFGLELDQVMKMIFDLEDKRQVLALKVHNTLSALGTWLFASWFFLRFKHWKLKSFVQIRRPVSSIHWLYAVLIFVGALFVSSYLIQVNSKIPFFQGMQEEASDISSAKILEKMLIMDTPMDLIGNLFFLALVPAVMEEIFFRGVFQNLLIKSTGNFHLAIAITSLLFAAVHLNPIQFLPMLFLAAMLGYSYYFSGSIWISVLIHFLNNGIAVILNYYKGSSGFAQELVEDKYEPSILIVLISLSACFYFLYRMSRWKGGQAHE